jgi:hypothetical protein
MKIEKRISSFSRLGRTLLEYCNPEMVQGARGYWNDEIDKAVASAEVTNPWFTRESIVKSMRENAALLTMEALSAWLEPWRKNLETLHDPRTIGIVMAGNIPLVGFHDLLCVLISGNRVKAKLSSSDPHLMPLLSMILESFDPGWKEFIEFTSGKLSGFDAIIATGSTNTSRYFEYYFGKYPHIIRKNRKSAAVLTGNESASQLDGLADDVFLYYGLGCRNISKLYLPAGYDLNRLTPHFNRYSEYLHHNKYRNNYDYHKSIFLVNRTPFFEGPFYMMTEEASLSSPVSVINYSYYTDAGQLRHELEASSDQVQCLVGDFPAVPGLLPFGSTQSPGLADYADNIDTMEFLIQKI